LSQPKSSQESGARRSDDRVRELDAATLGVAVTDEEAEAVAGEDEDEAIAAADLLPLEIASDDDVLGRVRELLSLGFAGVILTGPPGTSKTWYAAQLAATLVDRDITRVRQVQFHQSYEYADFIEGYVPDERGGFRRAERHFLLICNDAREDPENTYVLVIDELNRSDPGRIFGEALTYLETSRRGERFYLASGTQTSVPPNLVIVATMNPYDRGIEELDDAFERRFAKVPMDPSVRILRKLLAEAGMDAALAGKVEDFFRWLIRNRTREALLGHAFFRLMRTEEDLRRLWDHQLRFHFEKAFRLNADALRDVERAWDRVFQPQIQRQPLAQGPTASIDVSAEPQPGQAAEPPVAEISSSELDLESSGG
jgi:5-methylcytosine-specific restriction protein B